MYRAWIIAAMGFAAMVAARGYDDTGPFVGAVTVDRDGVSFELGADDAAWLDGERIAPPADGLVTVTIHPGHTFIFGEGREYWDVVPIESRTFNYYHLDGVIGDVARFTVKRYSVRTELYGKEGVRIFPNRVTATFSKLVKSHEMLDGGPGEFPGIEVGTGVGNQRLK
jgi:hypothetical protein